MTSCAVGDGLVIAVTDVVVRRIVHIPYACHGQYIQELLQWWEGGMSESGVLVQGNHKEPPRFASRLHIALPYDHVLL